MQSRVNLISWGTTKPDADINNTASNQLLRVILPLAYLTAFLIQLFSFSWCHLNKILNFQDFLRSRSDQNDN